MLESILKILSVGLMSGVKFVAAIPIALAYGYNYFETLSITSLGGLIGVFVFFQISRIITNVLEKGNKRVKETIIHQAEIQHKPLPEKKKNFTSKFTNLTRIT